MTRKKKSSSAEAPAEGDPAEAPKAPPAAESKPASTAAVVKAPDKPKAKSEAKAKGEAKAKAKPKAEAVEAAPKAKAEAKAKSEPKAKAEAKAKPEAKAKVKAEAKATESKATEPKAAAPKVANGKASAKPKAKGSAPAPVVQTPVPPPAPAPTVDSPTSDGLEVVVSRKNRRRKKKAEEMPDEPEEPEKPAEPSQEELARQETIKAEHDAKNNAILKGFRERLKVLPDLSRKPREEVMKEVGEQQKALQQFLDDIEESLKNVKVARPKKLNTGSLMKNMIELRLCKEASPTEQETKATMLRDVEEDLSKALAFESFRSFQAEMGTLKEQAQEKIESNDAIVKTVKSGNAQRRIVERVAKAKGIKADSLTEEEVKSVNVDLAPEVTVNSFLYKGKFEKQFGVIIDRPDGNSKGIGKGPPQPVKNLIVRGVESEVQGCVAALKALDLSDRKVLQVTAKQASTIMGSQQANARKLEETHEGVFIVHQAKMTEITFYGPPKKVAACLKEVQDLVAEDPASNPSTTTENVIRIDQDLAKAFIGPAGKNVKKLQADTGMRIEVDHRKEDESPASIKIVGDQANINKARDEINTFLKTLSTCIVEGDPEVVSRLFDSIRKGKGKGKGNGSNSSGSSRFADLYKNSGLTVLNKVKGVKLAGDKQDVTKWKAILEDCLREEATVPITVALTPEQRTLWNQERLDSVKQSSGASRVQKVKQGRETVIEVNGTDAEKEKAKASIDELNTKLSSTDSIEEIPEKAARSLSQKGAGSLKEVEQQCGVSVYLDWSSHVIKIQGDEASVADAKKSIEKLISSVSATSTTREIEIEKEEGGVIIGKSGSMVNKIKGKSGATVTINQRYEKKVVVLRGTEEQVEAASRLVDEALQNARNSKASGEAPASAEAPAAEKPAARKEQTVEQTSSATAEPEKRPAKSKGKGRGTPSQPDYVHRADSYPTLGSSGDKGKKSRPQNSAWKTTDEDENVEEAEEEDEKREEAEEEQNEEEQEGEKEEEADDAEQAEEK